MSIISLTRTDGTSVTLVAEDITGLVVPTDADLIRLGVTEATKVVSGLTSVIVRESAALIEALVRAILATTNPTFSASVGFTFNAALPTLIPGLAAIAPLPGTYIVDVTGTVASTDAVAAGFIAQLAVNGIGIGLAPHLLPATLGAGGNNAPMWGLGALGRQQVFNLLAGDSVGLLVGVDPGGVPGDDIVVNDCQITLTRQF